MSLFFRSLLVVLGLLWGTGAAGSAMLSTGEKRFSSRYLSDGILELFEEEKNIVTTPSPGSPMGELSGTVWTELSNYGKVSPLTPILISKTKEELDLVNTALDGSEVMGNTYLVPAIFLKYRQDKISKEAIETGVVLTLDVVTLVASGGTALATKAHWAKRVWAMAEMAGALGNIGVNTGVITNKELVNVVDAYNAAMIIIGVKNLAVGGYKGAKGVVDFAKELPEATKNLLKNNTSLKGVILAEYLKWKAAIASLGGLTAAEKQLIFDAKASKITNTILSAPEKELLEKQANTWKWLKMGEAAQGGFSKYTKIDDWLKGITDATSRANVENIIKNWSDDLLTSLNSKIDLFPGLKAELLANNKLLNYFYSLETTWWSKYGLGGLSKRANSTLPTIFKQMVGEVEVTSLGQKLKLKTVSLDDASPSYIGKLFDEQVEMRMIDAWKTNNFSDFPSTISTQLQALKNQGYELAIEAKLSINGKNPVPDFLLVKKIVTPQGIIYDYANVKYIDAKYLPDSPFSSNQLEIVNKVKNNGVADCVPFNNSILDVNNNILIPGNQSIKITTVEKLTIDNSMNLIIQ